MVHVSFTIQRKLFLGFLIVIMIITFSELLYANKSQIALQESIGENSILLAQETLDKIDRDIYKRIEEFQIYSKNLIVQEFIAKSNQEFEMLENIQDYIDEKDQEWISVPKEKITPFMQNLINNKLSEELRKEIYFFEKKYGYKVLGEVFVTNKYGANVIQTGKTTDYKQDDEEWWQNAKKEGLYISDIEYDESASVYSTDIGIRIDDESGNLLGIIKIVLNIEETINIIKELEQKKEYKTMEFKLITKDNRIIYSTEDFKSLENMSEWLYLQYRSSKEKDKCYLITKDNESSEIEKLFAYANSKGYKDYKGLGWFLFVEYETKEIFSPINELNNTMIILTVSMIIVAVIFSLFVSRSISKPIKKLTENIEGISKGSLDVEIDPKLKYSEDEIGKLARAFDRIIVSLKLAMKRTNSSSEKNENSGESG